jgi:site-specific DNA-cytosine methylase
MVRLGGNIWEGIVPTLRAEGKSGDAEPYILIIDGTRVDDVRVYEGPVQTLKERMGTGGNNVPIIAFDGYNQSVTENIYRALRIGIDSGDCIAIPIQDGREMEKKQNGLGIGSEGDPSYTLDQTGAQSVAYSIREDATANTFSATEIQTARALSALRPSVQSHHAQTFITSEEETTMQVRRLTPVECERLMGWPDNHTLPRADGKENPDTTRYKMCGNGVASPVAQWIGQHLMEIMSGP